MAFTASTAVLNSSGTLNLLAAQASQTVIMSKPDEKVILVVRNTNDSVAVNTATITIPPGDFFQNVLGTLSVDVADANSNKVIGPLESMRFKNSAGNITVNVAVTQSGTVSSVLLAVIELP